MSAMPITTNVLSERVIRARHHVPPRVVGEASMAACVEITPPSFQTVEIVCMIGREINIVLLSLSVSPPRPTFTLISLVLVSML